MNYRAVFPGQTGPWHGACGWTLIATGPSVPCSAGWTEWQCSGFFLKFLRFFFASRRPAIDPRSSIIAPPNAYDNRDQSAHYHIHCLSAGRLSIRDVICSNADISEHLFRTLVSIFRTIRDSSFNVSQLFSVGFCTFVTVLFMLMPVSTVSYCTVCILIDFL